MTQNLQHPLDLEPALEIMHVPRTARKKNDGLQERPPLDSRVLYRSATIRPRELDQSAYRRFCS
jgi:hypothetical protein